MHGSINANLERTRTKRRFCQFTRTASVIDLRHNEEERRLAERKRQAERYEARHGTNGKRSVFVAGAPRTARSEHAANRVFR